MRTRLATSILVAAFTLPLSAQTAAHGRDLALGIRAGSFGVGADVNKLLTSHLGLRVGANFFKYSTTRQQDDITVDANVRFSALTGFVDLYPFARRGFHLSAGVTSAPAELTGVAQPTGTTYEIDDVPYPVSEVGTFNASATYGKVLPYFGLGFGTPANTRRGLKLAIDLGVAVGTPTVTLSATKAASNALLAQDVMDQQIKAQDKVNRYAKVFPVVGLGLMFAF